MTIYKVEFRKQALKFLLARTPKEKKQLLTAIYNLPDGVHVKKMERYTNRYRLRVGDVRVIYEVLDEMLVILVLKMGNRGDVYK